MTLDVENNLLTERRQESVYRFGHVCVVQTKEYDKKDKRLDEEFLPVLMLIEDNECGEGIVESLIEIE